MAIEQYRRQVSYWLFFMCLLVLSMIVVGGLTRLTQSGLSMVEWRPLIGVIPPLTHDAWLEVFEKYKQYPEYQKINMNMDLAGFKGIFWLEYGHRVLGRIIGMAFALPFVYFLWRKAIPKKLMPTLIVLFLLGGAQGLIGWWMVKSGLVNRPDVSQYRLAIHLGMAFLLYVGLLWTGLSHYRVSYDKPTGVLRQRALFSMALVGLIFCTVLSGGLVAGLNAGAQFNTFPLMNGQLVPDGLFLRDPWYINLGENTMTVQFNHRLLAICTATSVVAFWLSSRTLSLPSTARLAMHCMLLLVGVQFLLGVVTLLNRAPLSLASLHQTTAVILLTMAVWCCHEFCRLRQPQATKTSSSAEPQSLRESG